MSELRRVAVAFGSNLGDRAAHLHHAIARLSAILVDPISSTFIETAAESVRPQPVFLNGALVGRSPASPGALLELLLAIEHERGRERPFPVAPRTLDLDLVLVGPLIVSQPGLELPHPRFRDRLFVLRPLAEIAPDLLDPVTGLSIETLLAHAERRVEGGAIGRASS